MMTLQDLSLTPKLSDDDQILDSFFPASLIDLQSLENWSVEELLSQALSVQHDNQLHLLQRIAYLLGIFLQAEWTGPPLKKPFVEMLPLALRPFKARFDKEALKGLCVDGEPAYHLIGEPFLFYLALIFLTKYSWENNDLNKLWKFRALFIQQRLLENPVASIYETLSNGYADLLSSESNPDKVKAKQCLEAGLIHHWYGNEKQARGYFQQTQKLNGFEWNLSGALGKRTKFQQFEVAQLVVLAKSKSIDATKDKDEEEGVKLPETLPLQDDTLLERTEITESLQQGNLSVLDQCTLLGFCLNVKRENPDHLLNKDEMLSFVQRLLQHPNNWSVHTMSLLIRSRLEANKTRTVERSVLQIQALVDQISCEDSTAEERLAYFFFLLLPSKWEMERELAKLLVSLGVIKSALEISLRLELWEDAIQCYSSLGDLKKAEQLLLSRLEIEPNSPSLLCMLGDLRQDPELWKKSWEASNHRYSKSMRTLGEFYFKKGDFPKCVDSLKVALSVNPLFEQTTFLLGCAQMNLTQWAAAAEAFTKVVSMNEENGEAWNNLASVYLQLGDKEQALMALRLATKHKREDWRVWTNYMMVSLDLGRLEECLNAAMQLCSELERKDFDLEVLERLVWISRRETIIVEKVEKLLSQLSKSQSAQIWRIYAQFLQQQNRLVEAFEYMLKAYRVIQQQHGMLLLETSLQILVEWAAVVVEFYQDITKDEANAEFKRQTCALLKSLLAKSRKNFDDTTHFAKLEQLYSQVDS